MQFPTLQFAFFFLIVLSASWAVRRSRVSQKLFLLGASYFFYAWWNWKLLALILISSLVDYVAGEAIARNEKTGARRFWLWLSILVNVGMLGFFKYYNFFQESFGDLLAVFGLANHLPVLEVILPIGISFYTFQSMAYTIDLYRGHGVKAESLLDFLLFIAFFPQLVVGPICRSRDLLPQLLGDAPQKIPDLSRAVSLIASGLFKKVVLASYLSTQLVDNCFVAPENYASLELLIALYGYTVQVYLDFSGYTDMALGLGLLLGFHLPENFRGPYAATNIGDFWRRWHISYSTWLRDYIYFSLGGSRVPRLRTYLNLMITMLVGGLWHGAHWKFVLWGAIHGVALILYKASLDIRRDMGVDLRKPSPWYWLLLGWLYTFHVCVFARVYFRAVDMETAHMYFSGLAEMTVYGQGFAPLVLVIIVLGLLMNFYGTRMRQLFIDLHEHCTWYLRPLFWVLVVAVILALKPSDVAPYIYFQF